ncbi:MAG: iron ABC transporter permease [Bauldia sp.]|nr:iron ABC transporter permease [Bauldia sp.]MCW5717025.1 iron ABC transporter permease [Bauldia sp.]
MALTDAPPATGRIPTAPLGQRVPRRWLVPVLVIAVLVLSPLAGLVFFAARGSGDLWPHLVQNVLPRSVRTTAILLLGVGAVVTIIGVGTAWLVAMYRFPGRRILEWALLLPLAVPTYIVAYAYLDVMHPVGPVQTFLRNLLGITSIRDLWFPEVRSMGGCIFLLGLVLYPYVYLPVRALFAMQSASYLEAARTLGHGPRAVFFRIAIPLARPAIAIGVTFALLETLNDVGASEFLGIRTMTVSIYTTWTTLGSISGAAQIALMMLALIFALLLVERWARRKQRYVGGGQKTTPAGPIRLRGWRGGLAAAACGAPVFFGFVVPASYLVHAAWTRLAEFGWPPDLLFWVGNTVKLAAVATVIVTALGLFLGYAARVLRRRSGTITLRLATIGYALPGTVLAVGLLVPIASLDNWIADIVRSLFGASIGLLLLGSGAALVFAYVLRFLPIAAGNAEAGLAKVSPSLDMAARSLGAGPAEAAWRIHLPLLRPALAAGALIVFVDCMKELPATLLLRPFNFETLSTQLYGEAVRGTYEVAAVSALAIVLVGLVPVILLARTLERRR